MRASSPSRAVSLPPLPPPPPPPASLPADGCAAAPPGAHSGGAGPPRASARPFAAGAAGCAPATRTSLEPSA